jgi:hypothetical protein
LIYQQIGRRPDDASLYRSNIENLKTLMNVPMSIRPSR